MLLEAKEMKEVNGYRIGKRFSSLFKVAPHPHKYLLNESETDGKYSENKQTNKKYKNVSVDFVLEN